MSQARHFVLRRQFEKIMLAIICSRRRIVAVALLFGLSTFLLQQIVHFAAHNFSRRVPLMVDSVLLGVAAFIFAMAVLTAARDRHDKVRDDLRMIAELNHQIRNALQVIVYGEYSRMDGSNRTSVLEGVEKIDRTLREMFPLVGERQNDRPWEVHNRQYIQRKSLKVQTLDRRQPSDHSARNAAG